MLAPKKTKYRKAFKGRVRSRTKAGSSLAFGKFGLKALTADRVSARQIEAARKAIKGYLKRAGKLWINIFPDLPVSSKPAEVRMGSGKGSVEFWAVRVEPGRILFELDGIDESKAIGAFKTAATKLPVKTKFIKLLGD